MPGLRFTKMHGLGNDYVYVGIFDQQVADPESLARAISDRHRGIGSDGLILVGPPGKTDAHIRMQMHNSDGSRAQMCGNGIRCVAKLAYERGWARVNPMRIATDAGVLTLQLTLDAQDHVQRVRVDMGAPILKARDIPVALDLEKVVRQPIEFCGTSLPMTCVSMGNPHAVFFVDDLTRVPLATWGPVLEKHALFPQRINVHFVQILDRGRVRMVTWERGAGPTQACGTGATAVCVAGVLTGNTDRHILAQLPGGELELEWDEATNHVFKTGPATEVFSGEWPA